MNYAELGLRAVLSLFRSESKQETYLAVAVLVTGLVWFWFRD